MRRRRVAAVAASLLAAGSLGLAACAAPPPGPAHPRATSGPPDPDATRRDIDYVGDGSPAHRLDLYLPDRPAGPVPVVVYVHGGAWSFGDKAMPSRTPQGKLRAALTARGYAVATVQYRFIDQAHFPDQLYDVKAALRYLHAHDRELGLDMSRAVALGDSAGGELALLAGVGTDESGRAFGSQPSSPESSPSLPGGGIVTSPTLPSLDLNGSLGTAKAPATVSAVVALYAVTDLVGLFADRSQAACSGKAPRPRGAGSAEGRYVGGDPEQPPGRDMAVAASPVTYASAIHVPVLLLHGTADCVVPPVQSRRLEEALKSAGGDVRLILGEGTHGDPRFWDGEPYGQAILDFVKAHLGPGSGAGAVSPAPNTP